MKVLVVIDMQNSFGVYEGQEITENILDRIEDQIALEEPIIFLEFQNHGRTLNCLREAVEDYDLAYFLTKGIDNGSQHIMDMFKSHNDYNIKDNVESFEFCGVNLEACVWRTVKGMAEKNPDIPMKIIHECCDSSNGKRYATNLVTNPKRHMDNVVVVGISHEYSEDYDDGYLD